MKPFSGLEPSKLSISVAKVNDAYVCILSIITTNLGEWNEGGGGEGGTEKTAVLRS